MKRIFQTKRMSGSLIALLVFIAVLNAGLAAAASLKMVLVFNGVFLAFLCVCFLALIAGEE